ncbi:hydroxyisourate hydrolase [Streptomyces sp. NPDC006186]|uniref:hydroxyisourate hydrolase n=1 Tax=Streptomyces sp. NPDC006186 TaxID=3155248 RepID=UPI0033BBD9BF
MDVSVTDGTTGHPVDGLPVRLERFGLDRWQQVWNGITDGEGRSGCTVDREDAQRPLQLTLETDRYFATLGVRPFYNRITVSFALGGTLDRHEVPIVINPGGYTVHSVRI